MTLLYSEVEEELRSAVRDLLADRCPPAAVLAAVVTGPGMGAAVPAGSVTGAAAAPGPGPALADGAGTGAVIADGAAGSGTVGGLWPALARDIGAAGLLVPEQLGGAGATAREAAVVLEELGRAVAPVPFLTSSVLATRALLGAGTDAARELLAALAAGETVAALAVPFGTSPYAPEAAWAGRVTVAGGRLHGRVPAVAGAATAEVLLVPAGGALYAVQAADAEVEPAVSLDLTRPVAAVVLSGAPGRSVGPNLRPVRAALELGAGLLASEQLGLAEWCLATTVAYVKERRQFARPVGSFQALKHRLADLWLAVAQARAAARNAADALARAAMPETDPPPAAPAEPVSAGVTPAEPPDAVPPGAVPVTVVPVGTASAGGASVQAARAGAGAGAEVAIAVAVAQAWCGEVAVTVAEECLQLHGGIGMTWEHPLHLYLKRAKADQIALGTPGDHRAALARLADVPGPPAG
ncbi:hypothetical protein Sru01_17370 [Sphaerisporangium rufum]|uniref:Acyl-CoA dehydrogenase n=1 Tax=Sphaerisporangium rufum TaxID=1381558 RepID=A0A919V3Z3_9ACTN|nr:acyl-CoA dehydrogenase family protein [Sphaerisporangium rufum]GII76755.1 hypothetical protein Sru01_17370 [Sphaerisporangium rufum]